MGTFSDDFQLLLSSKWLHLFLPFKLDFMSLLLIVSFRHFFLWFTSRTYILCCSWSNLDKRRGNFPFLHYVRLLEGERRQLAHLNSLKYIAHLKAISSFCGSGKQDIDFFFSLIQWSGWHVCVEFCITGTWTWGPCFTGNARLVLCLMEHYPIGPNRNSGRVYF